MLAPSLLLAGTGILVGAAPWGSICAALRAAPVALVPGRVGGQLRGDRRARAGLGCAGAGAELRWHRGTGVVVGVGVAAGQAGGQRGGAVAGAAVLQQDVDALLAARSPGIGQRGQPSSVPALHIHSVLRGREAAGQWYPGTGCPRAQEWQGAAGPWGRQEERAGRVGREREPSGWAGQCQWACGGTHRSRMDKGSREVGKHWDNTKSTAVEAAGSVLPR